jgi:hypothetical protein
MLGENQSALRCFVPRLARHPGRRNLRRVLYRSRRRAPHAHLSPRPPPSHGSLRACLTMKSAPCWGSPSCAAGASPGRHPDASTFSVPRDDASGPRPPRRPQHRQRHRLRRRPRSLRRTGAASRLTATAAAQTMRRGWARPSRPTRSTHGVRTNRAKETPAPRAKRPRQTAPDRYAI